ncbi:FhaA domain-containing protein [Armatimonas rosea]|uniref:PSer/pThr/pTyr-binding forkhead associated (FHA) protein n=1 Tax=Armatimonas rosea TaxID=685828 RepID=A0A7W9SXI7_ARMRO|nr:pSer/pThr/pTyr-binding forkhead associated (FHA) protein [Armatimonas rosea]
MDVLEKLNRRFTDAYEKLFKGQGDDELRPRDILRRAVLAMEDARREGLDGQSYVPNVYALTIAVEDDEERQLVRAFLDADELAQALAEKIGQHGYKTRGPLQVILDEVEAGEGVERVKIATRWEAGPLAATPAAPGEEPLVAAPEPTPKELGELGTVPAPRPHSPGETLAILTVQGSDGRTEELPLTASGLQIGRGKQAGNDLVLASDGMVSKKHARLAWEGGRFVLYDEGSTNGTYVGGERLTPGKGMPLADSDELLVGQTRLRLHVPQDSLTVPSPFAKPTAPPPLPGAGGAGPTYRLVSDTGEVFPLASRMLLGRALTDDIVLVGEGVSPQHARVTLREGMVRIEDLDSKAGTVVNGERIPANFPVALYPGDTIQLGGLQLRLQQGTGG